MRSYTFLRVLLLKLFITLLLNSTIHNINDCSLLPPAVTSSSALSWRSSRTRSSLESLSFNGGISFKNISFAARDFGNRYHLLPFAVLYPNSVFDISAAISHLFKMGPDFELTVTARGHGHSLQGQALNDQGLVINMESLRSPKIEVFRGNFSYVEVSGGELWINILNETLKFGFAPKSWTDYLHLTVGGTLSNAGISGQAFKHGPQINNVHQLEVVTGKGDVVVCSEKQNSDLFYGVLGGLGQFGIITRARISIEPAPKKVKWIRVLYSDFYLFTRDQEYLISQESSFDYVEGFVIINRTDLLNSWRSRFSPKDPLQAERFISDGQTFYCLEVAKYFSPENEGIMKQKAEALLSKLSYIEHTLFFTEVSYLEFLERVHLSEVKLREKGLWDVPHPWLSLLVPRRSIRRFAEKVFGGILTDTNNGPILIYPVNQSRWIGKTSMVTPEEDVFYLIGFLSSAIPSSTERNNLKNILTRNQQILDFCRRAKLGAKQYLPYYEDQEGWKAHFGTKWGAFARRKSMYDPLEILAPGHRIFQKRSKVLIQKTSMAEEAHIKHI